MRLSRTAWLILIIGVFVIAIGTLYWLTVQEKREQEELSTALATTQATLPKLAERRAELEATLAELEEKLQQVTAQLKTGKAAFPDSTESIEVDELLFEISDEWGLHINSLDASEPSDMKVTVEAEEDVEVEDITYMVSSFTVVIEGEAVESAFTDEEDYKEYIDKTVDDILNFIHAVVTHEDFNSTTVELVDLQVPEPLVEEDSDEDEEEVEAETEKPSATIELVIYSYQGE